MQLETNVRAEISDLIGATDASETHGCICRVRVPFSAKVDLYDRCEGLGEHVFLQLPYVTNTEDRTKSSVDALSIVRLPWSSLGGSAFKIPDHINVLEVRALLAYVKLLVREGRTGQRVIVVVDSGVVKGADRKFRSSSKGLNFVPRQ